MIVESNVQNQAILSNVSEIGEFRIKNSNRAFQILSSGLYSNKIRAIIRELSCNAYDSHVAADKSTCPFDVHLPNQLEPWFSIRDYGTGLNHEEIINIYTTYFESTKINSNDYVGALGLGSKSPFSYTDNFTVISIKNHHKGIYTAFINDLGVPSIALMMEESTDEPNGVEVKFSVNNRNDFNSFLHEARVVYTYFTLQPNVTGQNNFKFNEVNYDYKDIISGVHSVVGSNNSVAVMGNIAYPIDISQAEEKLGPLAHLLNCGIELHFNIGDLDIQASREGLSYIPQTISAIKNKLELLNDNLTQILDQEISAIDNLWEKCNFLIEKHKHNLWKNAVIKYVYDTNFNLIDQNYWNWNPKATLFTDDELADQFNIKMQAFSQSRSIDIARTLKPKYLTERAGLVWQFAYSLHNHFVINDTKIGVFERAKYHWRNTKFDGYVNVFVLSAADQKSPVQFDEFFAALKNPPEYLIHKASELTVKPRKIQVRSKDVNILRLEKANKLVWTSAGTFDSLDSTRTYYYLPLNGYQLISSYGYEETTTLISDLSESPINDLKIMPYGVRKADIELVKVQDNWINLEEYVAEVLAKIVDNKFIDQLAKQEALYYYSHVLDRNLTNMLDDSSEYKKLVLDLNIEDKVRYNCYKFQQLLDKFMPKKFNIDTRAQYYRTIISQINQRYPLLEHVSLGTRSYQALAEYISLIDQTKPIDIVIDVN